MKPTNRINQLCLWVMMKNPGLDVKSYGEDYPYMTEYGFVAKSSPDSPIYRYVKNYKVEDETVSLCMITLDGDTEKVEAWMDEQAKTVTLDERVKSFNRLERYYA